jgi:hypothetical protein
LGGVEWTLGELDGVPLDLPDDDRAPFLLLDRDEAYITGSGDPALCSPATRSSRG